VYVYYSGTNEWSLFGGKAGSGGHFSFTGLADTGYQAWNQPAPTGPAPSGPGHVQVYAASPSKPSSDVIASCTFSVQ
jgi:hypothetical protein